MVDDRKPSTIPTAHAVDARDIGDANWRRRRQTVARLADDGADDVVRYVLHVLRDEHRDLSRVNGAIQVLIRTPADVVPQLVELLKSTDADLRSYVALTLGGRGDPRAIDHLIEAIFDNHSNVRTQSIEALGKLRAAAAVDDLIGFLESRDFTLGFHALDALIAIGDERIAERLYPLLGDPMFKAAVVDAIGELGDGQAIQRLVAGLSDPELEPMAIIRALSRMDARQRARYGKSEIPQFVLEFTEPASIAALIGAAKSARESDLLPLTTALGWIPGPQVDAAFVDLLERWPSNNVLVERLASRGSQISSNLLSRQSNAEPEFKKAILQVLTRLSSPAAVPALLAAVEADEDEEIVAQAVDALARLDEPQLYRVALRRLGHPSVQVRQAAASAIASRMNDAWLADLKSYSRSESPLIRESVVRIAAQVEAVRELLFSAGIDPDERVRRAAIEEVAKLDDPRVFQCLSQAMVDEDGAVRAAAAASIAQYRDPSSFTELLISALADPDVWVRYFGVRSLARVPESDNISPRLAAIARDDSATQVRIAAVEGLAQGVSGAYETLVQLTQASDSELSAAAIAALPRTGHQAVLPYLSQLTKSNNLETSVQAIRALASTNDKRGLPVLRDFAVGSSSPLWREAIAALGSMHLPESCFVLVEAAAWPRRRNDCVAALAGMADLAMPALAHGLRDTGLDTRRAIIEALARIRTAQAIGVLETALNDSAPSVRCAAGTALRHLRDVDRSTAGISTLAGGK